MPEEERQMPKVKVNANLPRQISLRAYENYTNLDEDAPISNAAAASEQREG